VPVEVDWSNFLQWANWLDEDTLYRQRAAHVERSWRIYRFQVELGILPTQGMAGIF
jgi:hypothetical protein